MGRSPRPASASAQAGFPATPSRAHRRKKKLSLQWAIILGAVALPFLILGLAFVPVPHSYSLRIVTWANLGPGPAGMAIWGFPSMVPGSHVSGSWASAGAVPVELTIYYAPNSNVSWTHASSGSFSFTDRGPGSPGIEVQAPQVGLTIYVNGTYWSPEWPEFGPPPGS